MASAIIHIAVAKKVNEYLNMEEKPYFLGSIAPDLGKYVYGSKDKMHFLNGKNNDIPDIDDFLQKYKKYLSNPFEMGYFIHLLTDFYWFKDFFNKNLDLFTEIADNIEIANKEKYKNSLEALMYNDYTSLNIEVIDHYNLVLDLFYEDFELPDIFIKEVPKDKLYLIIEKMGIMIENSAKSKIEILNSKYIYQFIEETSEKIIQIIKKM